MKPQRNIMRIKLVDANINCRVHQLLAYAMYIKHKTLINNNVRVQSTTIALITIHAIVRRYVASMAETICGPLCNFKTAFIR